VHIFPTLQGIATRNHHPHEQTLLRPSKDVPQGCFNSPGVPVGERFK
jgi:hypothetical protein